MNTRIQVEHPVTELVTRRRSRGRADPRRRRRTTLVRPRGRPPRGAAIEVRINAEDTTDGRFLPAPGTLRRFQPPVGTTSASTPDTARGDELPADYDNLIAKVAVWGADREEARRRALEALRRALRSKACRRLLRALAAVLAHDDFRTVAHSTSWLADHAAELLAAAPSETATGGGRARCRHPCRRSAPARSRCSAVGTGSPASTTPAVTASRRRRPRSAQPGADRRGPRAASAPAGAPATGAVTAPMQGTVTTVDVEVGDAVTADTRVVASRR